MKKTNRNLLICAMVFAISLVISNVVTAKTIQTGIPLFGSTITLPGAGYRADCIHAVAAGSKCRYAECL